MNEEHLAKVNSKGIAPSLQLLCVLRNSTKGASERCPGLPTIWNSALYMLRRLIKLELPIRKVLAEQNLRNPLLANHQWVLAEKLVEALEELEPATTALGAEKYCTMSLVAPVIHGLLEKMSSVASLHQRHPSASFIDACHQS